MMNITDHTIFLPEKQMTHYMVNAPLLSNW